MTTESDRITNLEAVAEWAKTAMDRRELYEATERYPHETSDEYRDRREALWTNVKSAYAMLRASLGRLHQSEIKRETK